MSHILSLRFLVAILSETGVKATRMHLKSSNYSLRNYNFLYIYSNTVNLLILGDSITLVTLMVFLYSSILIVKV